MQTLTAGLGYVDLHFLGTPHVIATAILQGPGGAALVDPGPSTTLPALEASLERQGVHLRDLTGILLTHIHLDHAGATGTLLRRNPGLEVYVHERGAPHLIDPSKLLASATRLYGDAMDRLWGEVAPVPPGALRILSGGERIEAAGRQLEVAYTPGHAWHHVSYFDPSSGVAFVGDTAGVRIGRTDFVLPPTPPPDIELETWASSVDLIERWGASTLFLTHFGPYTDVTRHLREAVDQMEALADLARRSLLAGPSDEERQASYAAEFGRYIRQRVDEPDVFAFERAAPSSYNWMGLVRYLGRQQKKL